MPKNETKIKLGTNQYRFVPIPFGRRGSKILSACSSTDKVAALVAQFELLSYSMELAGHTPEEIDQCLDVDLDLTKEEHRKVFGAATSNFAEEK